MLEKIEWQKEEGAGFCIGNFGIAGEVSRQGRIFSRVLTNPPQLGEFLTNSGQGGLFIKRDGNMVASQCMQKREVFSTYPQYSERIRDGMLENIEMKLDIYAPVSIDNPFDCFIPCIVIEVSLENYGDSLEEIGAVYIFEPCGQNESVSNEPVTDINVSRTSSCFIASCVKDIEGCRVRSTDCGYLNLEIIVPVMPKSTQKVIFCLGFYHTDGYYANKLDNIDKFIGYCVKNCRSFRKGLKGFVDMIPVTGDADIDMYLRWYMSAGILLTKGLKNGDVLTMGYSELNQRDSYWTTWMHLVYWPELEKKMIIESCQYQQENGKIPTCILPFIDREDDIDINEYFILRIFRYYEWHRDIGFLRECWLFVKKAVEYLDRLDEENIGLPLQKSFWADWKDVPGVEGRKYSPHFALLWVAVLEKASRYALELGDSGAYVNYKSKYEKSIATVNAHIKDSGLWNGMNYTDIWNDGKKCEYVLQDQVVGAVYGLIPEDKLRSIYSRLSKNENDIGVRETFPYIMGFEQPHGGGGDYHNGGVWPYLSFCDAYGRYISGFPHDAERIIKKTGYFDLVKPGDFLPNEYMQGDTGENKGKSIQAWCADCFLAVFFGAFGLKRLSDDYYEIRINIPYNRDFQTNLLLPQGVLKLRRTDGDIYIISDIKESIRIRLGVMSRDGQGIAIGNNIFVFKDMELHSVGLI